MKREQRKDEQVKNHQVAKDRGDFLIQNVVQLPSVGWPVATFVEYQRAQGLKGDLPPELNALLEREFSHHAGS